jgi:tripartite-type tricarboxylate transporter receptor subunit TctC
MRFVVTFLLMLLLVSPARAQQWPSKPIRFVVPFPPGGGNDILGRFYGDRLSHSLGQPIVIENKPGAGGNIGAEQVARSTPDGYTFLVASHAGLVFNPHLYSKMTFDTTKDLAPVGLMGALPVVVVVHPEVPANNVLELIALAKSKPQSLSYASAGTGTPHHLGAELFKSMTGTSIVHVPYKGGAPAAADLLAGRVQIMFAPVNNVIQQAKAGKLRIIAAATEKRISALPSLPTVAESGLPGYKVENWIGLAAPAGTPKNIVSTMNAELAKVNAQPDTREKLAAHGIEPATATPELMAEMIRGDLERWGKVIREAGIKAD